MMQHTTINLAAEDQGLMQILTSSAVHEPVIQYLKTTCELKHTTDFLSYVAASAYETELADIIKNKFPTKVAVPQGESQAPEPAFTTEQQKIYIARLRAAYKLSLDVQDRAKAETEKSANKEDQSHPDLERPLDAATVDKLDSEWMTTYNFKFISHMRPAPQFRNRVFREMKMCAARLIPAEKAKSQEENKITNEPVHIEVGSACAEGGGTLIYETQKKTCRTISNPFDYMTALRVIMNTYAYCGTHKVASSEDANKQVTYFPFEQAIGYVDEITVALTQIRLSSEAEKLMWLRKRDEAVRSEMVALINDGWTGGEALSRAWSKLAHMMIMRDGLNVSASADQQEQTHYLQGQKRGRDEKGKGAEKGKGKEK